MIAEMCLALALYHEARGEPRQGQMMVAAVIVNRVVSDRFPDDMCEVIMQPRQFSFVRKGKIPKPKDDKAWKVSHRLASQVLTDTRILPPTVADHYHTTKSMIGLFQIKRLIILRLAYLPTSPNGVPSQKNNLLLFSVI